MEFPSSLYYTKDHEWVSSTSGTVKAGVTAFAVEQLGDIVHIELPDVGSVLEQGDAFGTIESTKTVSDLYMPVSGKIIAINETLIEDPESLQGDSYSKGWLIQVETSVEQTDLMDQASYESFIKEES